MQELQGQERGRQVVFWNQPVLCGTEIIQADVIPDLRNPREGIAVIGGRHLRVFQRYPGPQWPVDFEWVVSLWEWGERDAGLPDSFS